AGWGARGRTGRYSLRRRGGPRRLRGPRLLVDLPMQPRARPGWPEGAAAEGAFAPEGLAPLVTADGQACSESGPLRRLPAAVGSPDRAESETADVLRPPGKTAGPLGWRGPARLFDNEQRPPDCHARRRQDPGDERPAAAGAGRERVVLAALADRVVLQGTEVDAGVPPVPVPAVRAGGRLDGTGADGVLVPGALPCAATAAARLKRGGEALVGTPADLWPLPSAPPGERADGTGVSRRPVGDARRDPEAEANSPRQLPQ